MLLHKILLVLKTYIFILVHGVVIKKSDLQENPYKNCDYLQTIQSDQSSYYIFSPNYPERYKPNTSCRWYLKTMNSYKVVIHCDRMDMYESVNCTDDSIAISTSADELLSDAEKFCAPLNFAAISDKNEMIIVFTSSKSSKGGLFSCSAGTEHVPNDSKKSLSQRKFLYQRDVAAVLKNSDDLNHQASPSSNFKRGPWSRRGRSKRATFASAAIHKVDGIDNDPDMDIGEQNTTECDCGWTSNSRIVNGEMSGRHEFPSVAALVTTETGRVYCGGAIITNRHILTAAHCIADRPPGTPAVLVNGHEIWRGKYSPGSHLYKILDTFTHPDYNQKLVINDLGIIEVKGQFIFDENVGPVCLPFQYKGKNFVGDSLLATGWGTLSYGGKQPALLQKATLQVIQKANCSEAFGATKIRDTQICAIGVNASDTCQGDSGGPLLWSDPRTNRFVLAGIISYGIGCASGKPSVNVRISVPAYLRWIKKTTQGYPFCVK